jgi:hypothetical protein
VVDASQVRHDLFSAYQRLLRGYRKWGGWRYYGWTHHGDDRNYYGSAVWSEGDCEHRFMLALEKSFPGQVHCQLGVNKALSESYVPETDRQQAIDIVVSDFGGFVEGEGSQNRFRSKRHEAFIEAKWLKKGRWTKLGEHQSRAIGIRKDLDNLERALERGRCAVAAMLVFDDECALDFHPELVDWPNDVERLVVSPSELVRSGLGTKAVERALNETKDLHDENCRCARSGGTRQAGPLEWPPMGRSRSAQ